MRPHVATVLKRLNQGRDPAGLAAFRAFFGALMFCATVRFVSKGWVDEFLLKPVFHFTYWGFDWVQPLPRPWMFSLYALMAVAALSIAAGFRTRVSSAIFFLCFTYAELIEKSIYLNHYYLVSLLALLLVLVPASNVWSWDARRSAPQSAPAWAYYLLRCQIAIVYIFAGIAKLNSDWLLRAEPLRTWLQVHTDIPLIGAWLGAPWSAYLMSYAGALYDLVIVPLLLWPRTRKVAFICALFFHLSIWLLFPIGVFSWVMLIATTLFFDPGWPRHVAKKYLPYESQSQKESSHPLGKVGFALVFAYLCIQVAMPLRHLAYPGNVNWTEEGFRFAWRVMLVEKSGHVEYRVRTDASHEVMKVYPRESLTPLQFKMMCTQPDMIQQYAKKLAKDFRAAGNHDVRVYADAWASLNGRPGQRLIDLDADLADLAVTLAPKTWIVPLQER